MQRFALGLAAPVLVLFVVLGTLTASATPVGVRNVFLNGIDISTAKSQDLKNVDVHINENGDIFLIAPHYQVNEEDTYTPLSKYVKGLNQPVHRPPQKMAAVPRSDPGPRAPATNATLPANPPPAAVTATQAKPATADGLMPKAGETVPTAAAEAPPAASAVEVPALPPPQALPGAAAADEPGSDDAPAPDTQGSVKAEPQ